MQMKLNKQKFFLMVFVSALVLVLNTSFVPVFAAGGTITINKPTGQEIEYTEDVTVNYTVIATSGWKIIRVRTYMDDELIDTYLPPRRTTVTEIFKEWDEDNPGVNYHTIDVVAEFLTIGFPYTPGAESEDTYFYSVGTIYEDGIDDENDWTLKCYNITTGDEEDNTGFGLNFPSGYSNGSVRDEAHPTAHFYALATQSIDLSDWSKLEDISLDITFRAIEVVGSYYTNMALFIWGSSGDPTDYYFTYSESWSSNPGGWDNMADSGVISRTLTLDKDDFSTLTSLTIGWGFQNYQAYYYGSEVWFDVIEIYYEAP